MTAPTTTARDVLAALYHHFTPRWAMLTEVTARPVRGRPYDPANRERRIDALLLRPSGRVVTVPPPGPADRLTALAPMVGEPLFDLPPRPPASAGGDVDDGGIERLAIEVKVARGDFLNDVRRPEKQAPWRALAHRHAYAVPAGLITAGEVPADSGLILVHRRAGGDYGPTIEWARRAPRPTGHRPGPLPPSNLMDAYWRAARAEAFAKGLTAEYTADQADDAETLRLTIKQLRRDLELANGRTERARDQAALWRKRFATHELPACATCGHPLNPTRVGSLADWEHRDLGAAAGCNALRREAALALEAAKPERHRWADPFVPGPEPVDLAGGG